MKVCFMVAIFALFLASTCYGGSWSQSCTYVNGKQHCTNNNDPNGNSAGAAAFSNGRSGEEAAGVGQMNGQYDVKHGYNNGRK